MKDISMARVLPMKRINATETGKTCPVMTRVGCTDAITSPALLQLLRSRDLNKETPAQGLFPAPCNLPAYFPKENSAASIVRRRTISVK